MKSGKIYFLRRSDGLIKVGYSANLRRRLEVLTKSHGALEVVRLINGDKRREKRLHNAFARFNQFGEWFRDCPDLRRHIAELEEGSVVAVAKDDIDRAWAAGEEEMAVEARRLVLRLIEVRRQRSGLKNVPAMAALSADHGLRLWTVKNLQQGRPNVVTAYTLKALKAALLDELAAYRDELVVELAGPDEREASALAARVAAQKAQR